MPQSVAEGWEWIALMQVVHEDLSRTGGPYPWVKGLDTTSREEAKLRWQLFHSPTFGDELRTSLFVLIDLF